jgi:lactoylglutathione lyase
MFDEIFPILSTTDMARSLGFYRDLLGAAVTYPFPADGDPDYVSVTIGGSHLGIGRQDEPGGSATLWAYTDDCDAAFDRLRAAEVVIIQEPADQPWGERMGVVLDPDGNRVHIASR